MKRQGTRNKSNEALHDEDVDLEGENSDNVQTAASHTRHRDNKDRNKPRMNARTFRDQRRQQQQTSDNDLSSVAMTAISDDESLRPGAVRVGGAAATSSRLNAPTPHMEDEIDNSVSPTPIDNASFSSPVLLEAELVTSAPSVGQGVVVEPNENEEAGAISKMWKVFSYIAALLLVALLVVVILLTTGSDSSPTGNTAIDEPTALGTAPPSSSSLPTSIPSLLPSILPVAVPTSTQPMTTSAPLATAEPTTRPSSLPTKEPTPTRSAFPSDLPSTIPTAAPAPSLGFATFRQTIHVGNNREFSDDEIVLLEGLYKSYTSSFAPDIQDVIQDRIETDCIVTKQELVQPPSRRWRMLRGMFASHHPSRALQQASSAVEVCFEILYMSTKTDVAQFPLLFQSYVNGNLDTVATQMVLLSLDVTSVEPALGIVVVPGS